VTALIGRQEQIVLPAVSKEVDYEAELVIVVAPRMLPALGDAARTAFDPVLMIILSACCMQQRYFQ
jgi:2-keto-4-pentenoate hydratase/2-oxohepta-3-ene-1,7-dioic acid hydratase in catechol pathway